MAIEVIRRNAWVPSSLDIKLREFNPQTDLGRYIKQCAGMLPADMAVELIERISKVVVISSRLRIKVFRGKDGLTWFELPEAEQARLVEDYGNVGDKVITTAGVGFLVDAWQNSVELENMKYHSLGTGSTAEANGDTALVTELTTEYNPNDTRATGSLTEGASANIFRTVGTNTLDGTPGAAIREHGIHSAATAGVLWDRTVIASPGITLASADSLQSTYDMTASAGG